MDLIRKLGELIQPVPLLPPLPILVTTNLLPVR
jgi:hypothetical protein